MDNLIYAGILVLMFGVIVAGGYFYSKYMENKTEKEKERIYERLMGAELVLSLIQYILNELPKDNKYIKFSVKISEAIRDAYELMVLYGEIEEEDINEQIDILVIRTRTILQERNIPVDEELMSIIKKIAIKFIEVD